MGCEVQVLSDEQWAALAALIEELKPQGRTRHRNLRCTIEVIIWRPRNGAT